MGETGGVILFVGAALLLLAGGIFAVRFLLHSLQNVIRSVQDRVDQLQGNLLAAQQEENRTGEMRTNTIRTDLSTELQRNREELQKGLQQSTFVLETKVAALEKRVDERLNGMSNQVQSKLEQNLKDGFLQFEKVQHHLKQAELQLSQLNQVGQSINDLNSLLKLPHLRGGFGEATLERLLNDLLPQGAFELQYRIVPNSTERVDAVIHFPNSLLPIDSKFPREQVLPLFESNDPSQLEGARKQFAEWMKGQARTIKEKYIRPDHGTADMALLFVPSETLYFELLRNPKLSEDLARLKVFPVSPNTLAVTLHAISISRSYYEMAKGVEKTIAEVKKSQAHFENFERRFEEVGSALNKAQTAFGTATTHLSRYSGAVSRLTGLEPSAQTADLPPLDA